MTLPNKGNLLFSNGAKLFRDSLLRLIKDLGKEVVLMLKSQKQDCPNCLYDALRKRSANKYNTANTNLPGKLNKPFPDGAICPVCNGRGILYTENKKTSLCLLSSNLKENEFTKLGNVSNNTVKAIFDPDEYNDLSKTETFLLNGKTYKPISVPEYSYISTVPVSVKIFLEEV